MSEVLASFDPAIAKTIQQETERQEYNLEFIASENFVSERVMEVQGSTLTNKYAEGYPGKRYYGGCEFMMAGTMHQKSGWRSAFDLIQ